MANKLKKKTTAQKIVKKMKPVVAGSAASVAAAAKTGKPAVAFSLPQSSFVTAIGRRKTATARVRVYSEAGDFVVNDKLVSEYFRNVPNAPTLYNLPLVTADVKGKHAITVKVNGSGLRSQMDAVNHGIARALIKVDPDLRGVLKKQGLLSRDDRMKETRKIGTGGKARRTKQSPKR
jgi:small subunit ribosomal protein S9